MQCGMLVVKGPGCRPNTRARGWRIVAGFAGDGRDGLEIADVLA